MYVTNIPVLGRTVGKRKLFTVAVAISSLWAFSPAPAAEQPVRVLLDVSFAPDAGDFALKTSPLLLEWYPKINDILYGPDHPLPYNILIVSFQHGLSYPAFTTENIIHVSADTLRNRQDSYEGMVVHELTHVVQHYPKGQADAGWLVEGIADYIRHEAFEKDIQPTMHLDAQAHAYGYTDKEPYFHSLEKTGTDMREKGYLKSYTVASSFLFWLETRKDKQVVPHLNQALSQGQYTPELFRQFCGQPLDDLWVEYVKDSEADHQSH
jgi:hypothetical protein